MPYVTRSFLRNALHISLLNVAFLPINYLVARCDDYYLN
jgi:hypothetical protein